MRRLVLTLVLIAATSAGAAEKWWESYDRGVTAVNARSYKAAADALQKSIAEMPSEGLNVRAGRSLITYVPHFWLGIAKFNLGDVDGALREWRICEEQGVLARTDYYSRMKDWVARAQTEKQIKAEDAAAGSKKAADSAISKALELQLDALSAGGDRSASYLAAQRKLQNARAHFQKAGTDVAAYKGAEQTAQQAATLFREAAEDGKRQKAARAAAPPPARKQIVIPPPRPAVVVKTETAPPPAPVITEAEVAKRIAEQQKKTEPQPNVPPNVGAASRPAPPAVVKIEPAPVLKPEVLAGPAAVAAADLRPAYRAFASGDLAASEQLLTRILRRQPAAEAYLLRGCARYTQAMLSRTPNPLLVAATDDFRAALQRKSTLRLDQSAFSPKLVAFFEQVRKRR